jgi:hypothetical protein
MFGPFSLEWPSLDYSILGGVGFRLVQTWEKQIPYLSVLQNSTSSPQAA